MLAEMPESRISGQPTTSAIPAAARPPAMAPGKFGHSAPAMNDGRSGRNTDLAAAFMVRSAET